MYVRTKKGEIFDCYESEQMHKTIYYPKKSKTNGYIDYEDVYKKSDNIIDILEVGDYVNGIYIDIIEKEQKRVWHTSCYGDDDIVFYNNDIKSIVTKEQFENCMYKVGE